MIANDGRITAYTYDCKDNILTITEDDKVTIYSYSDNGNLVSIANPNGATAGYTYDSFGNLTGHTFNGYIFTYNTLGSIITASSESGELVNYTYSNTVEQQVLTSNFGNGQSVVYTYTEDGEIASIKFGEETKYGYEYFNSINENGEVSKKWTELTDYINNLKKTIEDNKTTVKNLNGDFIYSVENLLANEEVENSCDSFITTIGNDVYTLVTEESKDIFKTNETIDFTKDYTYTKDNLMKITTAGLTTSFDFNADKLVSVLENTLNDVSIIYGYTYDENCNITSETVTTKDEVGNVVTTETTIYSYDDKEQLISAESSTFKYEFTYDDRGNILAEKEYTVMVDENGEKVYTLIESNTDIYVYDDTWKDKLIEYNGQSITYDVVGNPTNYMGNALTWTMGRQLASFGNISYTYNEDGIRIIKTSNGVTTKFYLNGTNIIEQTDGITILYFFYDSAGEIVGFKYNNNNYLYVKNSMGDIVGISDSAGNLIASYTYDAWGKVTSVTGSNTAIGELNPFRYRSYYYDSDIQLYYLQSRYYDPETGRFINSDNVNCLGFSIENISYNAFAYCENEPVGHIDLLGYWAYDVHAGYYKTASLNKAPNPGRVTNKKYLYSGRSYIYLPRSKDSQSYYGTYYWAIQCGFKADYAKIIADYCNNVDIIYSPINFLSTYYQGWHFNINRGTTKTDSRITMSNNELDKAKKSFDKALNNKNKNKSYKSDLEKGLQHLGMALHPIQDIYAHTDDKVYLVTYTYVNQYGVKTTIKYWSHVKNKNTDNALLRYNQVNKARDNTYEILNEIYQKYKTILK
jgi:RHS repeat-associated protein